MSPRKIAESSGSSKQGKKKKAFVIDASAIFNGALAANRAGLKFIPDCVVDEVTGDYRGEAIIEEASLSQEIIELSPSEQSMKIVTKKATVTGDIQELSGCDLAVIAVALDVKAKGFSTEILSDDYDIQNLASYLKVPCKGVHWKGISWVQEYLWYCPACSHSSKTKQDSCTECGTKMKRKTLKRKKVK